MTKLKSQYSTRDCFFCGEDNPAGFKLKFEKTGEDPEEVITHFTPGENYRGLGRVFHGGLQCGLFDEIMGWTAHHFGGQSAVTGGLQIKFSHPVYVGTPITVRCRMVSHEGRRVNLAAELYDDQDRVCASATGTYVQVDEETFRELVQWFD